MRLRPPPGKKLVRDWIGLKVRTVRDMSNGNHAFPAGTVCTVHDAQGGLRLKREPCKHCGVSIYITRVSDRDVRIVHGD